MAFWNEIYGCVNYLNLPYETVMSLPTYLRKFWINKHNKTVAEEEQRYNKENISTKSGSAVNSYARIEQKNKELGLR